MNRHSRIRNRSELVEAIEIVLRAGESDLFVGPVVGSTSLEPSVSVQELLNAIQLCDDSDVLVGLDGENVSVSCPHNHKLVRARV